MQPSLEVEVPAVVAVSVVNVPDGGVGPVPDPVHWPVIVAVTAWARKGADEGPMRLTATSPANCWIAPAWAGAISVVWTTGEAPAIWGQVTTAVTSQICWATAAPEAQID
jgi:hypothetical protein